MRGDRGEVMVTATGDVLLTAASRYLSSPTFVSRDFEFDPLHQQSSAHSGDSHHSASHVTTTNVSTSP